MLNEKEARQLDTGSTMWPRSLTSPMTLTVKFSRSNFERALSGIVGLIDVEQKGSKSIGCWTNYVTFPFNHTHDLGHKISRSKFEIALSREWEADWHGMKGMWTDYSQPWSWPFSDHGRRMYGTVTWGILDVGMSLTHLIEVKDMSVLYSDFHGCQYSGDARSQDSSCDLKILWPQHQKMLADVASLMVDNLFICIFAPQPSGLVGYCHHGLGG